MKFSSRNGHFLTDKFTPHELLYSMRGYPTPRYYEETIEDGVEL